MATLLHSYTTGVMIVEYISEYLYGSTYIVEDIKAMSLHTFSEFAVLAGHCESSGAKSSPEHCTNLTIQIIFSRNKL